MVSMHFLRTRRFLPLLLTQFLGALNDNFFKTAVVMLATFRLSSLFGTKPYQLVILAGALYILPYILFCAIGGKLADRFDKAAIARIIKLAEVVFMMLASVGFYFHFWTLLFVVLFCMGVHSALFSPPKYALLPEQLREDELMEGNAFIESATFIATLLGTMAGGPVVLAPHGEMLASAIMLIIAGIGVITSRFIPSSSVRDTSVRLGFNPIVELRASFQHMTHHPDLLKTSLTNSWFYFVTISFGMLLAPYTWAIGANEDVGTLLLTAFTIGIGAGTIASGALLKGTRSIPLSALGMSIFIFDFCWSSPGIAHGNHTALLGIHDFIAATPNWWRMMLDLFLFSACGGFFIVPLYATLQRQSPPQYRAQVMACNNVLNAFFMVASAFMALLLFQLGATTVGVFTTVGAMNFCVALLLLSPKGAWIR